MGTLSLMPSLSPIRGPISRLTDKIHQKIYTNPAEVTTCAIAFMILGVGLILSSFYFSGYSFFVFLASGSLVFFLSLSSIYCTSLNRAFISYFY